ncbi:c-type cytochrome [Geoalkalibacter sp.]|uniref:c-type cytochrome n=1 Tax=Geoalkalibacter sp. TaxID=3041440 RepID=UPI00272DFC4C|nr:cytochrome c [Geoalkalibacter sp.]
MKTTAKLITLLIVLSLGVTSAWALEVGNPKKGKFLFKKSCKSCHVDGAEGGKLAPLTKTQAQWQRFFERDKHGKKPEAWSGLSAEELNDILQYVHDHAADSPQPDTCG